MRADADSYKGEKRTFARPAFVERASDTRPAHAGASW